MSLEIITLYIVSYGGPLLMLMGLFGMMMHGLHAFFGFIREEIVDIYTVCFSVLGISWFCITVVLILIKIITLILK